MASQVTMPQMGFDMQEGRLVRWLKAPGDPVQKGEALAEIETDKATVELEAFESGRLVRLLVEEGRTVPVGEPLALLETETEAEAEQPPLPPAPVPDAGAGPVDGGRAAGGPVPMREDGSARTDDAPPRASSVAGRVAEELDVDLGQVKGTGPAGRILERDVTGSPGSGGDGKPTRSGSGAGHEGGGRPADAGEPPPPRQAHRFEPPYHDPADYLEGPASSPDLQPWTRMRQAIARRMVRAVQQIPHFYVSLRVEMDPALAFRMDVNQGLPEDDRITVNDLLVRAAALALEEFPTLNGTYTEEGLRLNPTVDVAVAVAVEGGLLTPVIRDCTSRRLVELAREVHRVVRAARKGRLKPEEYAGGTFTVSNLGMFGVESFSAIINPPQTAILAAGGAREEVLVTGGRMRPATVMRLTVAADHRVSDGVEVARFLNRIRELLEHPWLLVSPHLRA